MKTLTLRYSRYLHTIYLIFLINYCGIKCEEMFSQLPIWKVSFDLLMVNGSSPVQLERKIYKNPMKTIKG